MLRDHKIPVTIITGFLGSGKTTLLNRILKDKRNRHAAVIINEFGETSIDGQLVMTTQEEIVEINNGCICCNVRGDLIRILKNLISKVYQENSPLNRIIIETTGLANPAPVIQTFLMDEVMSNWFEIDAVCTVVDSKHLPIYLDRQEEALEQIAFADLIILNKIDLITPEEKEALLNRIKQMNVTAEIMSARNSNVPLTKVMGVKSFNLDQKLKLRPNLLTTHHHHHTDRIQSFVLESDTPLILERVNKWFSYLVQIKGETLYRYKGILNIQDVDHRVVFQGVHMLFASNYDKPWRKNEKRKSELVFIGNNLDREELEKGFNYCMGDNAFTLELRA
ncbi:CobW family GTP-binding protein [Oceanobacillus kapialis]|uniref:CobW family GTP-binding protein n=1 Tax=Oceanobacillus kapialis TaxID=481353 RepID=A0ABW5PVW7_9BACI